MKSILNVFSLTSILITALGLFGLVYTNASDNVIMGVLLYLIFSIAALFSYNTIEFKKSIKK